MSDLVLRLVINGTNDGAVRALNQVVSAASGAGTQIQKIDSSSNFSATRQGLTSISTQLANLKNAALAMMGVDALAGIARGAIAAADEMKGIDSRIRLATRSWQEYSQTLAGLKKIAFEAGSALGVNVALATRIADPVRAMGGSQKELLSLTQAVNNSLRITNATTAEAASATLQFAQAMGAGVLRGEELNSILENAPRLAKAIADGLGITVSELKTLGEQGALTSQQVFNALKSQQAKLTEEAGRMPVTVGQAWMNAQEGVKQYIAALDSGGGATASLASAINVVAKNIPAVADALGVVAIATSVAFGSRAIAALAVYMAAQRAKVALDTEAAGSAVRMAQTELAVAQAVAAKAAAELRAISVTQSYTLATNEAATAEARRAAASRLATANAAVSAATSGVVNAGAAAASVAATARQATLLGTALTAARTAGTGLLALFGGPWGLAITAITAGIAAWELFGKKAKAAGDEAAVPVADLLKNFNQFSQKSGPNELEDQLITLRGRAAELRDQLLDPAFRSSDIGKQAAKDVEALDKAVAEADQRIKTFNSERVKEKGQLSLDKLKLDVSGLVSDDTQKSLQAFGVLYSDFVTKATNDNGKLKVSALEAKAAIDALFQQAKTPADFTAVIERLMSAAAMNPKDATLKSYLENAIEARFQADAKALDALVAGMQAKAQRTQALFTSQAGIILAQFSQAQALARVTADLNQNTGVASQLDTNARNAEVANAVSSANLQIASLEQIAARKRALAGEAATAAKQTATSEIAAAEAVKNKNIAAFEQMVEAGERTAAQLKDYRVQQETDFNQKVATARAARLLAEGDAARQIAQIDGQTAQQRAAIAENLYKALQGKAADALNQYKTYAQQVQSLDKSIANNRLDTMSAIGAIQRQDATPKEQLQSLRDELAQIQAVTADAFASGQKDFALELLNRQKSLASQLAGVSGEGVDKNAVKQEAIDNLAVIGQQADAILQEQRAAAQSAAQQQLQSYQQMVQAMNDLAGQIAALNEKATIKLKPEIDQTSLDGAVAAVKAAFANITVPVKVTSDVSGTPAGDAPARAFGGPLPGYSPSDRADNMLYWGTAGEWVIQRPTVRYYGADFLRRLNAMQIPRHAFGGQLGESLVSRLRVPSLPSYGAPQQLQPAIIAMPDGSRFPMSGSPDVISTMQAYFAREALRKGRRS